MRDLPPRLATTAHSSRTRFAGSGRPPEISSKIARSSSVPRPSANAAFNTTRQTFQGVRSPSAAPSRFVIGESPIDVDAPSHSAASRYSRKSGVTSFARRPSPNRLASLHRRRAQSAELEQVHFLSEQKSRVDIVDDDRNAGEVFNQVLLDSRQVGLAALVDGDAARDGIELPVGARSLIQALACEQPVLATAPAVGTDGDLLVICRHFSPPRGHGKLGQNRRPRQSKFWGVPWGADK